MKITVMSFGFKYGEPTGYNMVFDVRAFKNPFYVKNLKNMTGNDKAVQDYVLSSPASREFLEKLTEMTEFIINVSAKRKSIVIAIGCTGGQHRSVTFANMLAQNLKSKGYEPRGVHRDINK